MGISHAIPSIGILLGFWGTMSTGRPKDGELKLAAVADKSKQGASSTALVEYTPPVSKEEEEEEDLDIKLRRIMEHVPVRVNNMSGSSPGSGSGDFHQLVNSDACEKGHNLSILLVAEALTYRRVRQKEQDRFSRMDDDYQKRKELQSLNAGGEEHRKEEALSNDDSGDTDNGDEAAK
ncbi:hypothetical protein WN944_024218 [Citrus x changshan-huyou]|uniref:Uncharacterized protein n=1 Tax=Citrus x changshan-huyou TaxID=2935761 RepID=A0AAP0LN92_9ROSI